MQQQKMAYIWLLPAHILMIDSAVGSSDLDRFYYGYFSGTRVRAVGVGSYGLSWLQDASTSYGVKTSTAGSHTHTLYGDSETRPMNMSVNYIIKY